MGDLTDRLHSRSLGLARQQMPGGGEAYSGGLANEALGALGARAMTMDGQVFVNSGFDASNPSDLALWGHESLHAGESGGSDSHSEYDSEEQQARAHERMILHQADQGMDPESNLSSTRAANPLNSGDADTFAANEERGATDESGEPNPVMAYQNMLKDGMSHDQIIRTLSEYVVTNLERQDAEQGMRTAHDS